MSTNSALHAKLPFREQAIQCIRYIYSHRKCKYFKNIRQLVTAGAVRGKKKTEEGDGPAGIEAGRCTVLYMIPQATRHKFLSPNKLHFIITHETNRLIAIF